MATCDRYGQSAVHPRESSAKFWRSRVTGSPSHRMDGSSLPNRTCAFSRSRREQGAMWRRLKSSRTPRPVQPTPQGSPSGRGEAGNGTKTDARCTPTKAVENNLVKLVALASNGCFDFPVQTGARERRHRADAHGVDGLGTGADERVGDRDRAPSAGFQLCQPAPSKNADCEEPRLHVKSASHGWRSATDAQY